MTDFSTLTFPRDSINGLVFVAGESPSNDPPSVAADSALVTINESQTAANSGTFSDSGLDTVTIASSIGIVSQIGTQSGTWSWSFASSDGPNESQTVVITATDSDGDFTTTSFDLIVLNVAPSVDNATFETVENSPDGTLVGTVTASDPGADTLAFSITGGTSLTAFAIDSGSGVITVADSTQLDFETTMSFTLVVEVTDDDGAMNTADITVNLLNQASITGTVFVDTDQDGHFEANEMGIDGVTIQLLNESGDAVLDEQGLAITAITSDGGFYLFEDLDPSVYRMREVQPTGVDDGVEILGSAGGSTPFNDTMQITLARTDAVDYIFAEIGQAVTSGDTAAIGFWQNKHGQALIELGGAALANWLTDNLGNVFGDAFVGGSGADVAGFFKDQLFKQKGKKTAGPAKVDAEFMAVAFATYFTSRHLAGEVGADFGFNVTDTGIGTKIVNVGDNGAAFNVAEDTDLTIMQLLLATNDLTDVPDGISGFAHIYDQNGDGVIDDLEEDLRRMAHDLYVSLIEVGGN